MTLFELKENMATLRTAIESDANWISEKAADPAISMEEINAKKQHRDELQSRFDMLKSEHDTIEARQRESVKAQSASTEKGDKVKAKAAFYRDAFKGDTKKAYEGLGAIPAANADLGNGDKLLPTNLANELLVEPVDVNPLRAIAHVTNITGYEEPKLGYTIEDADIADVTDKQTANEIALEGDVVAYGRMKAKVMATVKESVFHGTEADIVTAIEGALGSALAKREKHFAFLPAATCATDTVHKHMSFYNKTANAYDIATAEGETMYKAIVAALGDLADEYTANASVVMKKSDYYSMVESLANNSESLFGDKPASILGHPVVFCDKATIPVVGDFSYYGINYDIGTMYETDKDVKKGEYYFVFTAWGDQQIRLKSAFRLAVVNP